jgi:hypothetical protein
LFIFFEFQISESEFRFLNFSTAEFEKKILPKSSESKTELEFRFRWGSQKTEPKIGIPNLGDGDERLGYGRLVNGWRNGLAMDSLIATQQQWLV